MKSSHHSCFLLLVLCYTILTVLQNGIHAKAEATRHQSFAPVRKNSNIQWHVDGQDYFDSVIQGINSAQSYMYISAWWLTPKVYLKRPHTQGNNSDYQLDALLKRKAKEGVNIFVILYNDIYGMESGYASRLLTRSHPRIHVIRCPDIPLLWSYHEKFVIIDGKQTFIGGFDLSFARYDTYDHVLSDYPSLNHNKEMYPGQDYNNPRVHDFQRVRNSQETLVDRTLIPRMPWHDVSMSLKGGFTNDLENHFVMRWNYLRNLKILRGVLYPVLPVESSTNSSAKHTGSNQVQLVRSASYWSTNIELETSFYQAYLDLIAEAKHYIYIENQYFISSVSENKIILNKIGKAIVDRIILAHQRGETFKVIVMIPLLPGFQGDLTSMESNTVRAIMYLQYISISRSDDSIHSKLRKAGINPSDYIEWYSLRTFDKITPPPTPVSRSSSSSSISVYGSRSDNKKSQSTKDDLNDYVTEMVYIHSKVMIIDDRKAVVGSANVNDRSLLGDRDAEVGGVIEDTELVSSYMGGKKYQAGKSILEFRLRLWKEHLGLMKVRDWRKLAPHGMNIRGNRQMMERQMMDPLSAPLYQSLWRDRAKRNTLIYRDVFHCVPDDTILTYNQHVNFVPDPKKVPYGHLPNYKQLHDNSTISSIHSKLRKIQGHLVEFPLDYLNQSDLINNNLLQVVTPIVIFS